MGEAVCESLSGSSIRRPRLLSYQGVRGCCPPPRQRRCCWVFEQPPTAARTPRTLPLASTLLRCQLPLSSPSLSVTLLTL